MALCAHGCTFAQEFENSLSHLRALLQKEQDAELLTMPIAHLRELPPRDLDNMMHGSCDSILEPISSLERVSKKLRALHNVHVNSFESRYLNRGGACFGVMLALGLAICHDDLRPSRRHLS